MKIGIYLNKQLHETVGDEREAFDRAKQIARTCLSLPSIQKITITKIPAKPDGLAAIQITYE